MPKYTNTSEAGSTLPDSNGYYTVSEAADLLKVGHSTVRRWIKQGKLPAQRIGPKTVRITQEALRSLLAPVPPHHNGNRARPLSQKPTSQEQEFLNGGGEMGERIRTFDWAATSLGPIPHWPPILKTTINLVLQSPVPLVALWGPDGIMIYNDAYAVFAGARHPFLLGSKVVEGWPEVAEFNRNVMKQGLSGKTLSYQDQQLTLYRHNVPEEVWMDLNYSPILDESGKPAGVLAVVVETTQRVVAEQKQKQAEAALQAERDRLQTVLMQAPASIAVLRGPQHMFELANPVYRQLIGTDRDVIGKTIAEALPEIPAQGFVDILNRVYRTGKPFTGSEVGVQLDRKGGGNLEEVFLNFACLPLRDAQGEVDSILAHAVEVTEQVKARQRVEEHNRVLAMITGGAPLADVLEFLVQSIEKQSPAGVMASVLLLDQDGKHLRHGAAPSLPKPYNDAVDGLEIGPNAGSCGTAAYTKEPVIVSDIANDPLWKDFKDIALKYGLRSCWSTPIFSTDRQVLGTFALYYDEPRMPGSEDRQIIDFATRTAALVIERKFAEKRLKESEARFRALAENIPTLCWMADADGWIYWYNKRWYDYTGTTPEQMEGWGWQAVHDPDILPTVLTHWKHSLQTGTDFEMTFPLKGADGVFRPFLTRIVPIRNEDGAIIHWFGTNTDIARQVELERQKEAFLGIASHELRTPLTTIKAYTQILDRQSYAPKQTSRLMEQVERMERLITELLDTSRLQQGRLELHPEPMELGALAHEVVERCAEDPSYTEQHHLVLEVSEPVVGVWDRLRLDQVLTNLVSNAIKYSQEGGEVRLTVSSREDQAVVTINDQGMGMDQDEQTTLFAPFQRGARAHTAANGMGLGLYIAAEIVKQHGGSITVDSTPARGTTFTVSLPRQEIQGAESCQPAQ